MFECENFFSASEKKIYATSRDDEVLVRLINFLCVVTGVCMCVVHSVYSRAQRHKLLQLDSKYAIRIIFKHFGKGSRIFFVIVCRCVRVYLIHLTMTRLIMYFVAFTQFHRSKRFRGKYMCK